MSTLSEIAANLLKRERMTEGASAQIATQDAMGWEQMMTLSKEQEVYTWQATLNDLIAKQPSAHSVTAMGVIEGGVS